MEKHICLKGKLVLSIETYSNQIKRKRKNIRRILGHFMEIKFGRAGRSHK